MKNTVPVWLAEIRANFLILSVLLVMVGGSAAWNDGHFNIVTFLLTVVGVTVAHISVNLYNEYSDWKTGIDDDTVRTPFSGGSGTLQEGLLSPGQVKLASKVSLIFSGCIGLYLASVSGWPVLALMAIGGITIVFYTEYLARWMIGELAAGLTLGSFVVLGSYYVQTGFFDTTIVWASITPGILTMLLLLLNEFPDTEADKKGGRKHMVIVLGKHRTAYVYACLLMGSYLVVAVGVILGSLPVFVLISLLTLPLAIGASLKAIRYSEDSEKLIPAQGMNVIVVLATDFLMAVGFLLA